ncbi:hypothetical protein Ccrd_023979 [Cynara cardunculus var. scolymus]|uniref:Uncharacterized protein n=2 Tax=Cynara cardunculus var. scolymus TaxID=59895 RepID=A0A103EV79_CYNCS|nr:hypothetical protein Ccrd_023979 [Cynara cardunculus var. scolymus]
MLKERNKKYNSINFVDISSDDYSPEDNQGLDYKTAMGTIHAIMSDGTVVTSVEVCSSFTDMLLFQVLLSIDVFSS